MTPTGSNSADKETVLTLIKKIKDLLHGFRHSQRTIKKMALELEKEE